MGTVIIVLAGIIVFLIAIVSPHAAGKIQYKTDEEAGMLKRIANWLWNPLTWLMKSGIEFARRAIVKVADWGKQIHKKLIRH